MIYYKMEDDHINKYEVIFDLEEIKEFRSRVIEECSTVKHIYKETSKTPYLAPVKENIRNYKTRQIRINYIGTYEDDEIITAIEYDEYEYPYLVKLIDKLLKEKPGALDEIYNPDFTIELKTVKEMIKFNLKKLKTLEKEDKRKLIKKTTKLYDLEKFNLNQQPIEGYYYLLQEMISFTLIDSITVEEYEKKEKFFDKNNKKNILSRSK